MLHFVPVLALMAGSVDPAGSAPASLTEAAAQVAAQADGAAAAPQATPAPAGGYKIVHEDGATTLTLENAEISLSNRLQFRFIEEIPPDNVRLPGTTADGQSKPSFRIRRAKTSLEGWFWKKELTYEVQLSWAGPEAGASTQTPLEDALLTWDALGDSPPHAQVWDEARAAVENHWPARATRVSRGELGDEVAAELSAGMQMVGFAPAGSRLRVRSRVVMAVDESAVVLAVA